MFSLRTVATVPSFVSTRVNVIACPVKAFRGLLRREGLPARTRIGLNLAEGEEIDGDDDADDGDDRAADDGCGR